MKNSINFGLSVVLVLLWGASMGQCTINMSNTSVGFTPGNPKVIQPGMAYAQTVQVFVPTTYSGITIDSIHIDTITNIPAGITYVLNPATGTVVGNGNGAFCLSGTTNAAPGPYLLDFVGLVYSGTATIPLSAAGGSLSYKLRVETVPVAAFGVDSPSCAGTDSVTLADQSTGYATNWTWTISGGSPATSHLQNPKVYFDSAGSYTVKLLSKNSVSIDSITQNIVVNPAPTGSFTSTPASSASTADGAATVILTGGTPPYVYLWSNNAVTDSIDSVLPGSYWVLAHDAKGCQYLNYNVSVSYLSGIQLLNTATLARVYPNPASDVLNLEWFQKSNAEVVVYDLNGRVMRKWVINADAKTALNIQDFASGEYLMRITDKASNQQQDLLICVTSYGKK